MRPRTLLLSFLLIALAPTVAAQDACTQSSPCDLVVSVGPPGFLDEPVGGWNVTTGDWARIDLFNEDEVAHRVTLEGHGVDMSVAPLEQRFSEPFQWGAAGPYAFSDDPSGDTATVNVFAGDFVEATEDDATTGADGNAEDRPTPGLSFLVAAIALAFAARRR